MKHYLICDYIRTHLNIYAVGKCQLRLVLIKNVVALAVDQKGPNSVRYCTNSVYEWSHSNQPDSNQSHSNQPDSLCFMI